jgi:hypothetical protein
VRSHLEKILNIHDSGMSYWQYGMPCWHNGLGGSKAFW